MKPLKFCLSILLLLSCFTFPQPIHKIMSYNALNYPGSTSTERNPYFSTVVSNVNPYILVIDIPSELKQSLLNVQKRQYK